MFIKRDLHSYIKVVLAKGNGSVTGVNPVVGYIIDTQGFDALEFLITSPGGVSSGKFTPSVLASHNPDMSNPVAMTGDDLIGDPNAAAINAGDAVALLSLGVVLSVYRYVQLNFTNPASVPAGELFAYAILAGSNIMTRGNPNTNTNLLP